MLSIGTTAYQNAASSQTNDSRLIRQAASTSTTSSTAQPSAIDSTPSKTGDKVSLSPEVEVARLRESLGLNPTGKLTRHNFEAMIQSDQDGVRKALQANLDKLATGISDTIGTITLSQDAKGQIQVAGDWPGKEELAKNLNADPELAKMFTRLSRNSGLLSYADQTVAGAKGATLTDYLDSDTADTNLTNLLKQYDSLKTSKNSLASLINLSSSEVKPFALTYKGGASVQQS